MAISLSNLNDNTVIDLTSFIDKMGSIWREKKNQGVIFFADSDKSARLFPDISCEIAICIIYIISQSI